MAIPLVVGIDGSESSPEAVDRPAAEAARHSPSLHLVHTAAGDRRGNAFALVLGSRGLRDLADMPLGAVSLAVAVRAACPGVVVPGAAEHRNGRLGNILVGVEEGEGSGTALQFALREAQVRSCRLTAVHAWNQSPRALTPQSNPSWYALEAPRRPPCHALDDALRGMTKRYGDARASPKVIDCPARRTLLRAASAADLLVVGARRRRGHPGLQQGLINHALLHHAPRPVAVVPQI